MYNKLQQLWNTFRNDDKGVTLVEYGVAVALAVLVGTTALSFLADDIDEAMGAAGDVMPDAADAGAGG